MVRNVLSIGHNKSMNYLIWTVLSKLYKLTLVENVFEGMHLIKNQRDIDLVIIDMDYRTKESADFIIHISSSQIYKKTFIILLSEHKKHIKNRIPDSNVHEYFIKPFNPLEFIESINKLSVTDASSNS